MMNISILQRCGQGYYNQQLEGYPFTFEQVSYLLMIFENEGILRNELKTKGNFDQGQLTKGIESLIKMGYLEDAKKHLYTTELTENIIGELYLIRKQWWEKLTKGLSQDEIDLYEKLQEKLVSNALHDEIKEDDEVSIFGIQKLSLLDYPGKMACTLFTGGCNFRCPFCHNGDLVFLPENINKYHEVEVFDFLKKRVSVLEGVCISGGEPLLQKNLKVLLKKIKALGYQVKLDTNGTFPNKLKELVEAGLVDYVAMDIKNDLNNYAKTAGLEELDVSMIQESVQFLMKGTIPYEFRTTVVKEFHHEDNFEAMGKWLAGAEAYYLQSFEDGPCVIQAGLHACSKEELQKYEQIIKKYIPNTSIRGI